MTRRHEMRQRMQRVEEIRKILGAMKSLAYMETRKLTHRIENQQLVVQTIEQAAADFLSFHPYPSAVNELPRVFIVIGSERGFCGDLNQKLLHCLEYRTTDSEAARSALIAVGYRIGAKLQGHPLLAAAIEGADTAEEIDRVLARIVDTLAGLRDRYGPVSLSAVYLSHETDEVTTEPLLPPFEESAENGPGFTVPPLLYLQPQDFLLRLVDQFLLAALHEILYASLMAENRRRVQHLDGALRHLDRRLDDLRRKDRQLRQEEIIEEIEVILLGSAETYPRVDARLTKMDPPEFVPTRTDPMDR
jgi:F-type H+-transporting ATPase subunit gamma